MKIFKKSLFVAVLGIFTIATLLPSLSGIAAAAQITNRKVTISTSQPSATASYSFNFTVAAATAIQSVGFQACTTASGACTTPSGFTISGSTLASQPTGLGAASGWTANTSTAGQLRVTATNATAPSGSQTVTFNSVTNPSATNATFFFRITTYSDTAWATPIDTGNVATSTAGQVTVTATIDETLTFTLSTSTVALGTLSTSTTSSGTSTMSASTNATSGYNITVSGSTLTSGPNTITALSSPTASSTNTKQFGLNLVANTTPSVGTAVSGSGSGTAQTGYGTANSFKFVSGDTVAAASVPTNSNSYTTSYIANIDGISNPGLYSTVLSYVATANY
jgi:hypothetical protein